MKRCSTCNRTYTDPNLSYCIEDGTPLTPVEDESTVVSPRGTESRTDWSGAPYQPPGSYVPPAPARRRRVWPWVMGIVGAFILGIIAISIVAAVLAPRLLGSRQNEQPPPVRAAKNSNVPAPANSNVNTNVNSNTGANEAIDIPPPTDEDVVKAQLRDLEHDWTVANINADKRALDRILADDYVGPASENGPLQTKAEYIRTIERDTTIRKWDFDDLKLELAGDRATLTGKVTIEQGERELKFDFIDKFVWRDGRWQATSSEVKRRN